MNPNEFLKIMESFRERLGSARFACQNAIDIIELAKLEVTKNINKFSRETDRMMGDLQKEKVEREAKKHGI